MFADYWEVEEARKVLLSVMRILECEVGRVRAAEIIQEIAQRVNIPLEVRKEE